MIKPRIQPPRCVDCGVMPYTCPSCGDYQCRCPLPWLAVSGPSKKQRIVPRVHYDRQGHPYKARFIDDPPIDPYPTEDEDERWLEALLSEGTFT